MKIAMFVNNLEVSGGYQKLVIRLAQQLTKFGHEVTTYTPALDRRNCYPKDIKTIKIITLIEQEQTGTLVDMYEKLADKVAVFDALIIHDELSLIAASLLPKRKTVWMLNNQLPENLAKYTPELKAAFSQIKLNWKDRLNDTREARRRVGLMKSGLKKIDRFATYDSFNKNLVEKYLGRAADIVYAGADLEKFKKLAKSRHQSKKNLYQVLSVGVVFPHRRYEDLIRATYIANKDKKTIRTVIIGRQDLSPDYFRSLKELTAEMKLNRYLKFINYVSDAELAKYYRSSDVFAFINDGFTWGISVFEAVAAKLPVIITDNIGAVDLIHNGRTGWVVPPRDSKAVATAIKDIVDNDDKSKRVVEDAFRSVENTVSWEAYAKRMIELIKDIDVKSF